MNLERVRAKKLEEQYRYLGLKDLYPGFNNEDIFIIAEVNDASLLSSYIEYINVRSRDCLYDDHVRNMLPRLMDIVCDHLTNNKFYGRCAQTVYIMSQLLNHFGIWNYVLKGAVNVELISRPDLPKAFFWAADGCDDELGHYWIVAPPFHVVDPSILFQLWSEDYLQAVSSPLMVESVDKIQADVEDLISNTVRAKHDIEDLNLHHKQLPYLMEFHNRFPAYQFTFDNVRYRYVPVKVHTTGSPENILSLSTDPFKGKELWEKAIATLSK